MNWIQGLIEESKLALGDFIKALESKDFKQILKGISTITKTLVFYMEEITKGLKDFDIVISSKDKHEAVLEALKLTAIKSINDKIDIPFLSEDTEEKILEMIFNVAIKGAVSFFNSKGWKLE